MRFEIVECEGGWTVVDNEIDDPTAVYETLSEAKNKLDQLLAELTEQDT